MPSVEGDSHADGERGAFCAGAEGCLLESTVQERRDLNAFAHDEGADAKRPVELVRGAGKGIDAKRGEIDGEFADDLGGVGMDEDAVRAAERGEIGDLLEHARFVASEHDGNEMSVRAEEASKRFDLDHAVGTHREAVDLPSQGGEVVGGSRNAGVLEGGDDEVADARTGNAIARFVKTREGEVVGLGATAGEDHSIFRAGAEEFADAVAHGLQDAAGFAPRMVLTSGIRRETLGHFAHGDGHGVMYGRCCGVVEVNRRHAGHYRWKWSPVGVAASNWASV
jgi:hypothetical protein